MPPKRAPPKAGGKKGPPGMIAKLKQAMDARKLEEERLQAEAESEEKRLRAEERLAEEQRKFEEEQRRAEREQHKAEAKDIRKEKKKNDRATALDRMRASGMILPDIDRIRDANQKEALQRVAAPPKPKAPKPQATEVHQDPVIVEEEIESVYAPSCATESDDNIDEDDWEATAERDERREARRLRHIGETKAWAVAHAQRMKEKQAAAAAALRAEELKGLSKLRSPICCVLGHVDTGKTSLLDRIRATNVQGGEAGGITQQIGATFFPRESLEDATRELNKRYQYNLDVPGLLVIDTPGHESFTNLRSRGSSLCDIAVLVVDIMHGLEPQTKESIRLLRERKCPFIVALNKVDRLYEWVPHTNMDIQQALEFQKEYVRGEFETRLSNIKTELLEQGLQSELYYKNTDVKRVVSIVPTSAKTGEGISDLLLLEIRLVQQFMEGKVTFKDELECTILEVKPVGGVGFTIDVVLINGELREGDKICVCGSNGAIVTSIRALLTPQPMRESRVSGDFVHHRFIRAAMGVKIAANELEFAVPGTQLYVIRAGDDEEKIKEEVMKEANCMMQQIDKSGVGVTVQSSTLGSLEALLSFLKDMKIPVANVAIGPMHKRHMLQVISMQRRNPRYAVVLAFDVKITDDARELADVNDIEVFEAKIIYHLFDKFTAYNNDYEQFLKDKARKDAVFPVRLEILSSIRNDSPMILAVKVAEGQLHPGTPLVCMRDRLPFSVGRVMSIERDGKDMKVAKAPSDVAVRISTADTGVSFGRHISEADNLISHLSRRSIDAIKMFRDELSQDDTNLIASIKQLLKVPDKAKYPQKAAPTE